MSRRERQTHAGKWMFFVLLAATLPRALAVDLYLPRLDRNEALKLFPPPPPVKSEEEKLDREVFRNTRKLAGTARWSEARNDNSRAIHSLLGDFSCSANVRIREHKFPELSVLLFRTLATGESVVNDVKSAYQRPRPFQIASGPLCFAFAEHRVSEFDYPSGHATSGWLVGLVLAELWPKRSAQILSRAREYGESRVICGVHSLSATEAGEALARSLFKMLQVSKAFQRDLEKVKAEIARNNVLEVPDVGKCQEEEKVLSVGPRAE